MCLPRIRSLCAHEEEHIKWSISAKLHYANLIYILPLDMLTCSARNPPRSMRYRSSLVSLGDSIEKSVTCVVQECMQE